MFSGFLLHPNRPKHHIRTAGAEEVTGALKTSKDVTFDAVPTQRFEELYEFKVTPEWLDDVRLSALEFPTGCSTFVSAMG